MNNKKPVKIHEFDTVIYPFKLWVACTNTYKPLNIRFNNAYTKKDLDKTFLDNHEAVTYAVQERESNEYGCLVVFTERKFFTISNMAHEASHVVDFLFEHIGEKNIGDEAKAYLMGWVVGCMNKVKINKF
jgi:hypothetical protein